MSEPLTIELPDSMAAALRAAVDDGAYVSADAVIQDALRLWLERRADERELGRLRAAWDKGKQSGRYGPIDFDTLRSEARARLAAVAGHDD